MVIEWGLPWAYPEKWTIQSRKFQLAVSRLLISQRHRWRERESPTPCCCVVARTKHRSLAQKNINSHCVFGVSKQLWLKICNFHTVVGVTSPNTTVKHMSVQFSQPVIFQLFWIRWMVAKSCTSWYMVYPVILPSINNPVYPIISHYNPINLPIPLQSH